MSSQLGPGVTAALLALARTDQERVRLHEFRLPRWTVHVSSQGHTERLERHERGEGVSILAPREAVRRSNGIVPLLITDAAQNVLGLPAPGKDPDKAAKKREAHLRLLEDAALSLPFLRPLAQATRTLTPAAFPAGLQSQDLITFRLDGLNPHLDPRVQAYWINQQLTPGLSLTPSFDAVTGQPARLTSAGPLIGRLRGGQHALVYQSRNLESARPYGDASLGVGYSTVEAASAALRSLLDRPDHCLTLDGLNTALLHWTLPECPDPWAGLTGSGALPDAGTGEAHLLVVGESGARLLTREHWCVPVQAADRAVRRFRALTGGVRLSSALHALGGEQPRPDVAASLTALCAHAYLGVPLPAGLAAPVIFRLAATFARRALELPEVAVLRVMLNWAADETPPEALRCAAHWGHLACAVDRQERARRSGHALTLPERHRALLLTRPQTAAALLLTGIEREWERPGRPAPHLARLKAELAALTLPPHFTPQQQAACLVAFHTASRAGEL